MWRACALLLCACASVCADGGGGGGAGEGEGAVARWRRVVEADGGVLFATQTTVLLTGAGAGAGAGEGEQRRHKEVGYRIAARLAVHAARDPAGDLLLRFQLREARLWVRGVADWAERGALGGGEGGGEGGAWWARARGGRVVHVLLPRDDPAHLRDYKKALVSLFQVADEWAAGGNETDVSGDCEVAYEALSDTTFRKIKRRCASDGAEGVAARRVARYEADGRVHAEEVVTLHDALKARCWLTLAPDGSVAPPADGAAPPPLRLDEEALAPRAEGAEGARAARRVDVGAAVAAARGALGEAAAGSARAAGGALRLVAALRGAEAGALAAALRAERDRGVQAALCRALGQGGARGGLAAARDVLHLAAADALQPLADAYLAGFALAPHAQEEAVLEVAALGEEARAPAVRHAALLAAAGAARGAARDRVRRALARGLPRCADAECRAARLLALANLRADADALLPYAESAEPRVAAAALHALGRAPALAPPHVARLAALAANGSAALEARAAALTLVVEAGARAASGAAPLGVVRVARALAAERSAAAHELRRVLWQSVDELRDAEPVRALLALLPRDLRTWDARAHAGTSGVLARDPGWGGGGRARLRCATLALGGVVRRAHVALALAAGGPLLDVAVWTRGLHALSGAAGPDGEAAAGGLALAVGGVRTRDVTLFDGQAELLGHIWAGTGGAPTPVVRAVHVLRDARAAVPLLGGVVLRGGGRAAAALALDAHAAVSLWQRAARGALALRAALRGEARAAVRTPWAALEARASLAAAPRLRIAFELDFYERVALCVRAASPAHAVRTALRLRAAGGGARGWRVARGEVRRTPAAGRTLALGRDNDAACRTLLAADDDDDDAADDENDDDDDDDAEEENAEDEW